MAFNGLWSEGALHGCRGRCQPGTQPTDRKRATSIQAIATTSIGLAYAFRSGHRNDTAPQPLAFVGTRTEAGYSLAVGTGYNPAGYAFHTYQINATGTGPRNAQREVEVRAEYGPVAQ